MGNLTRSQSNNIASPDGNGLAIYVDGITGALMLKDINGKVQPLSDYVPSTPTQSPFKYGIIPSAIQPVLPAYSNVSGTPFSVIHGGVDNQIANNGNCSIIFGGNLNTLNSCNSVIGAGCQNYTSVGDNANAVILGGYYSQIRGLDSVILGGGHNYSACVGVGAYASINTSTGGGAYNCNLGSQTTIIGGFSNYVAGNQGFVGGGCQNSTGRGSVNQGVVFGGFNNIMNDCQSLFWNTTLGGKNNQNNSDSGTILGGLSNIICQQNNTIVGGCYNKNYGNFNFIANGQCNSIIACSGAYVGFNFIGNGFNNQLVGSNYTYSSSIVNGCNNNLNSEATNGINFIGSGQNNIVNIYSSIVSGYQNQSLAVNSTILNGNNNIITQNKLIKNSFIGNGENNLVQGNRSSVFSGAGNVNFCEASFVGGGRYNGAYGDFNSIFGGELSAVVAPFSFIGGGSSNVVTFTAGLSAIVGGLNNEVYGNKNFIGAGCCNLSRANYDVILGGKCNNSCTTGCNFIAGGGGNLASYKSSILGVGSCSIICNGYNTVIGKGVVADNLQCFLFVNNISIKNIPLNSIGLPRGSVWADYIVGRSTAQLCIV